VGNKTQKSKKKGVDAISAQKKGDPKMGSRKTQARKGGAHTDHLDKNKATRLSERLLGGSA